MAAGTESVARTPSGSVAGTLYPWRLKAFGLLLAHRRPPRSTSGPNTTSRVELTFVVPTPPREQDASVTSAAPRATWRAAVAGLVSCPPTDTAMTPPADKTSKASTDTAPREVTTQPRLRQVRRRNNDSPALSA